jgi:DNA-binding NarL/FixJ family response regulator
MQESKICYFCPTFEHDRDAEEIQSISSIIDIIETNSDLSIDLILGWPDLLKVLQSAEESMLIVFRLDFLERKNMSIDEVLSMMSSLARFVTDKTVYVAVIVLKPCDQSLISKLKRNNVLGIIPGIRYFGKDHSISAYTALQQGKSHWPKIAIESYNRSEDISSTLTERQYQVFNLVAKRGLSNKKIAELLNINEDTVKAHVGTILKKYGLRNRTQLALANKTGELCD